MRGLYDHDDAAMALSFVKRLGKDLQYHDLPEEARSLGRPLLRWKHQIAAWHEAHVTNAPTDAAAQVVLASTHERALEIVLLEVLREHAVDVPFGPGDLQA